MKKGVNVTILFVILCIGRSGIAICPSADLTGDCRVNLADLAVIAAQWLEDWNYLLSVNSSGVAEVTIRSSTDHGGLTNYTTILPLETDITLTAPILAEDMLFTSWTGDVNSLNQTISFLLIGDMEITANYGPITNMVWVTIEESGFTGQMSKYETTNALYCQYLNNALASGDIVVIDNYIYGADGSNSGADFSGVPYYQFNGTQITPRINYNDGSFNVTSGFENHPVIFVSWYGATAFCNYYGWRLPTEWEWQAVADYDGSYTYGCGTGINTGIANYFQTIHPNATTEVGTFGTYGYGMCDMAGNVFEWTSTDAGGEHSIKRGGAWDSPDGVCSVSYRSAGSWNQIDQSIGFRACR